MTHEPVFLEGSLTVLRPLTPKDAGVVQRWINDPIITHYMFYGQKPTTLAQVTNFLQKQLQQETNVVFIIEERKNRRPIGLAGLYDCHPTARKGEFRILLGDRSTWNRGIGTEVTDLLTYYGFDRLNLNRVWLGVTSENAGAVKAYQKSGYKMEGTLREDVYRNSRYYDSYRMGLLRADYYPTLYQKHKARFDASVKLFPKKRSRSRR